MKVLLKKASDWNYEKYIEINTLQDLLKIYESLIIETNKDYIKEFSSKDVDLIVKIYDDYVE